MLRKVAKILCLTAALAAYAQSTTVKLDFACKAEDIEALGLACTEEEPCPVFLELVAVESTGARLIVAGNFHTEAHTLFSVLLVSEDNGKTWTEPSSRIRGASLDSIQFVDLERGWISGGLNLSLPRDPFFMVTTDGGKTWRDRPVFDEGHIGTIADFWFENRNNGRLLIDRTRRSETGNRYELHETQTGGDTWEPKQLSGNPLSINRPKAPPEASVWRIKPDNKSKTIRLEQNTGKTWAVVTTFPIRTGDCRPPAPPPPPPTPPQP